MKCKDAQSLFSACMDKALSSDEARELTRHLEECASCREELALWKEAGSALADNLDCMTVPSTSLEEFVSAVTSTQVDEGVVGRVAAYLAAPRRALAATLAGSLALTSALLLLAWVSVSSSSPMPRQQQIMSPFQQYRLIIGKADLQAERELRNGS